MPFQSESQRRFMFSQHPEIAKEFEAATPKNANLPEHVSKMADGGEVKPDPNEPGLQDATASDFLLPYLLGPTAKLGTLGEAAPALEGLSKAAPIVSDQMAPVMGDAIKGATTNDIVSELEPVLKGVQKGAKGTPGVELWNVKGDPEEIAKLGFGPDPASIPKNILQAKGILPTNVNAATQLAPNQYAEGGKVERSSLEHPIPNGMTARAMDKGGYPHVTFLENESPSEVKKDTHMEGHKAGPMNTTETGEKKNPPQAAKGGVMSHEDKMKSIYKAMGIKKYADGGAVSAGPTDASPTTAPSPSDPTYWDQIKAALSQVGGAVGNTLNKTLPTMPGVASGAADVAASPGLAPVVDAALGTNISGPAIPPPPTTPPTAAPALNMTTPPMPSSVPATPSNTTMSDMPNIGKLFNQDTSQLTEGVNPEDRQALANKLREQQHGLGAIVAQAVAGIGDAFSAKGGRETHALGNIFSMEKTQRDEALSNFDKARQDRIQKLQLQTQMGDNALKQAAAADAYGVDEHLNDLLGAPKGTMKKDLSTYMGIMSSQIAAKEKDEDLYMKSHAQASTDVDNAVKNASVLGIKPSSAQLQASGQKLADNYYNRAKGNVKIQSSDGQALWIPASNIAKAKQLDPNLQVQP